MLFKRISNHLMKKKYRLDDSGAAILTVMVVTVFITILATTLLYITGMNYQMKQADYQNKQCFYKCETLLDDLKGKLTQDVSVAFEESYRAVMIQYTTLDATSRQEEFQKAYMAALKDIWIKNKDWTGKNYWNGSAWKHESPSGGRVPSDAPSADTYTAGLKSFMKFDTIKTSYEGNIEGEFDIKWIGDKDGNFITQIDESVTTSEGEVITTVSEKLFVLKGIRASFVSETGYSSYIITDLGIKVPEYDFTEVKSVTDMTKIEPVRMTDCIIYINWKRY